MVVVVVVVYQKQVKFLFPDKFKLDRWLCEILQVFFALFPDPEFSYEHIYFYI